MAAYRLLLKGKAAKEIDALPSKTERQRIVDRINILSQNPRGPGCEKLATKPDRYRIRQGRFRVIYEINDRESIVIVVRVADRKDVYR